MRTTHSDLAKNLEILAEKLRTIPAGYLVSDASTNAMLLSTAQILVQQDQKIGQIIPILREVRGALPKDDPLRVAVVEALTK